MSSHYLAPIWPLYQPLYGPALLLHERGPQGAVARATHILPVPTKTPPRGHSFTVTFPPRRPPLASLSLSLPQLDASPWPLPHRPFLTSTPQPPHPRPPTLAPCFVRQLEQPDVAIEIFEDSFGFVYDPDPARDLVGLLGQAEGAEEGLGSTSGGGGGVGGGVGVEWARSKEAEEILKGAGAGAGAALDVLALLQVRLKPAWKCV